MNTSKIIPAVRTENITYAVRDIIVLANEVAKTGKEMLYLNIGDPNIYDLLLQEIWLKQHIKLCSIIKMVILHLLE